jgi:subtilisin
MLRQVLRFGLGLCVSVVALALSGVAGSTPVGSIRGVPAPSVVGFSVSPAQLDSGGGSVGLSGTVAHATSCTFAAVPAVAGLPVTVGCSSGSVGQSVTLPANSNPIPQVYLFTLIAKSTGAPAVAKPVTVTVAAAPKTEYVVVFRDGIDAAAKARRYGATPIFVYSHALSGFAAPLGPIQLLALKLDRDVLMVTTADRDAPQPSSLTPQGNTPIEGIPQNIPNRVRRVGGLNSPTAQIDGVDQRVNADIAIIDTGIDPTQPDLNVVGGVNCGGENSSGTDDEEGHGTEVAGVVGALDNSFGTVGIAPGVRLWSVRVFNDDDLGTDATILCGLDWVDQNRSTIEVANLSLIDIGSDDGHCGLVNHDPVHWGICHVYRDGVTLVAGAGNDGVDASDEMPASFPEVITVSGFSDTDGLPGGLGAASRLGDPDDTFSYFSNFGAPIDIGAPDECIGTTYPDGQFTGDSGTSFATPLVAGAAALYLAKHPGASPAQVKAAILANAFPGPIPGDPDGFPEGILNVASF